MKNSTSMKNPTTVHTWQIFSQISSQPALSWKLRAKSRSSASDHTISVSLQTDRFRNKQLMGSDAQLAYIGHSYLVLSLWSGLVSWSLHVTWQVSITSGYDLGHSNRHVHTDPFYMYAISDNKGWRHKPMLANSSRKTSLLAYNQNCEAVSK